MIHPITLYGAPVLRQKCPPITTITPELHTLAADMLETMAHAQGIGLAAPQIGLPLRLAVIDITGAADACTYLRINGIDTPPADAMPLIFLNPTLKIGKPKTTFNEGCLSFPELRAEIRRGDPLTATLTLLDGTTITLETDGLLSRAIQHETDHLNGILFIDRTTPAAKLSLKKKIQKMWEDHPPTK